MQSSSSKQCCNLPKCPSSSSNSMRPRVTGTRRRDCSSQQSSDLHRNLVGFSLVPAWLQFVDEQLTSPPSEYPFPPSYNVPHTTTYSSRTVSTSTPSPGLLSPSLEYTSSGLSSPTEQEDRMYWEEAGQALDMEEQMEEDMEAVYRSITY